MIYDVISAIETNTDIITIQYSLLKKINLFGLKPEDYSLETVNMFYNDALSSKYKNLNTIYNFLIIISFKNMYL